MKKEGLGYYGRMRTRGVRKGSEFEEVILSSILVEVTLGQQSGNVR